MNHPEAKINEGLKALMHVFFKHFQLPVQLALLCLSYFFLLSKEKPHPLFFPRPICFSCLLAETFDSFDTSVDSLVHLARAQDSKRHISGQLPQGAKVGSVSAEP